MNLHEYQAKQLFARYGVPVTKGEVASTPAQAAAAADRLGGDLWVVKAQVHAGGRGKAGGVKLVRSSEEVAAAADAMLGQRLTTKQTGAEGLPINQVFVEAGSKIERELYLSMLVDRSRERIAIMVSQDGGMDIEEVAANTPERIIMVAVHPAAGLQPYQARQLGFALDLNGAQIKQFIPLVQNLYRMFDASDASLVEINPLIVNTDGDLLALDAKINIEDNALFRQPGLQAQRDTSQEDRIERSAAEHDLNYV
ncbi:MAG: acetate--CoA ligase family protein, partial [Gammaproteobacteria bacterium]|nr:acetate--CoA ligase family protein [Gammaproteobacteria bacterium]